MTDFGRHRQTNAVLAATLPRHLHAVVISDQRCNPRHTGLDPGGVIRRLAQVVKR